MHNLETKLQNRQIEIETEITAITENVAVTPFITLGYSGSKILDLAAERQAIRLALKHVQRETPAMAVEKIKDLIIHRMIYDSNYPDPIREKLEKAATEHLAKIIEDSI